MATDRDAAAVARALSRAFDEAEERSITSDDARLIVLSDQHKGARDAADDFQRCEPADVTGVEVAEGEIRLVRWPADDGTPQRKILARRGLDEVLVVSPASLVSMA